MTDEQIIMALEDTINRIKNKDSLIVPKEGIKNLCVGLEQALDLINRKDAEIAELARLKVKLHKKYLEQKAENERLKEELVSADEVIGFREAEIERLKEENTDLKKAIETMTNEHIKWGFEAKKRIENAKSEAYKEFAERLCKDRVSNDPVVIAVKVELEELTEGGNEPPKNDFKE